MDPNQWRNFNHPYGQPPGVGLSTGLPRLDLGHQHTGLGPGKCDTCMMSKLTSTEFEVIK